MATDSIGAHSFWQWVDELRRTQGQLLTFLGFGPEECSYRVIASGGHWRLRAYAETSSGATVLIVAAPIKRPYIWDLCPRVSCIRNCVDHGLGVYLLEWIPPRAENDNLGLEEYVLAIGRATTIVTKQDGGVKPYLIGHSLGGTLAAIFAAFQSDGIRGLILLSSPLSFHPGASLFGDALVTKIPPGFWDLAVVPGSLVSAASVLVSPEVFIWLRLVDWVSSLGDLVATEIHLRVEHWALDEVPVAGKLVGEIEHWLYCENRFFSETLVIQDRTVGPSTLRAKVVAVLNSADGVAAPQAMTRFLDAMPYKYTDVIQYGGESGVGFQHVALLTGRKARATVWPEIFSRLR
jgi:polyhydroxyalkanoate synthase